MENMPEVNAATAEEWESVVTDCFVPLSVERVAPAFNGWTRAQRLGDQAGVTHVRSGASTLARRSEELARSGAHALLFVFHEDGEGRVSQYGRDATQRPGESVMYLTDDPYRLDFPRPITEIVLQLPLAAMDTSERRLRELSARSLPSTLGLRAARALAREVLHDPPNADPAASNTSTELTHLQSALCGLLDSAFSGLDGEHVTPADRIRLEQVKRFIAEHASDPRTSTDTVAAAFAMSRRSLYKLFDDTGDTPATLIRNTRLRRAERILRNEPERPIAQVWALCGFDDPTTFGRAFKARTGMSPMQFRHTA